MEMKNLYWGKTIGSILIILLLMPLGHALMIIMEHTLEPTTLHYSAFAMGFVGLIVTICGVFVKGDTKQTCYGMTGALLLDRMGGIPLRLLRSEIRRALRPGGQRYRADGYGICEWCRGSSYLYAQWYSHRGIRTFGT